MHNSKMQFTRRADIRLLMVRIGLLAAGLLCFDTSIGLWERGPAFASALIGLASITVWGTGVVISLLALTVTTERHWSWLVLLSVIVSGLGLYYLNVRASTPLTVDRTGSEMISQYALTVLKDGQNPYSWNFSDITRVYENSGNTLASFLDGSNQNRLAVPALPTLLLWAFDRLGLGQVRIVNLVFYVLLLILVFITSPHSLRPIILLPLAAVKIFADLALGGAQDVVWSAMLVGMIVAWRRPLWRAILFGLAISFQQQPWLIAPFLIIELWQEGGTFGQRLRRIALFGAISGGLFLIINLPFMVGDFQGWWLGVFEPVYAAFNVYSQGLSTLSMYGIAPFPREFYTILQLSFLGCALFVYWRHPHVIGPAVWIVPGVFFWLYYRGLANDWLFWIPPFLVALPRFRIRSVLSYPKQPSARSIQCRTVTLTLVGLVVIINGAVGLNYLTAASPIRLIAQPPFLTIDGGGWIGQMSVTVSNTSAVMFSPRFSVQSEPGGQALPWTILTGSETILPGETDTYTISADEVLSKAVQVNQSAQVVVTDAGGNYNLRALLTIPAATDPNALDPISNPTFIYWPIDGNGPQDWTWQPTPQTQIDEAVKLVGSRDALTLTLQGIPNNGKLLPVRLNQTIAFPGQFSIWVYPTRAMTEPLTEAYGLEVADGWHRLWIVFGGTTSHIEPAVIGLAVAYIAAPLNVWTKESIDLAGLYAQLNWPLPGFSTRTRNGVVYQTRQVQLSLIACSSVQLESTWYFGGIEQAASATDFDQMIADTLDHPAVYYDSLFHRYWAQANLDQAICAGIKAVFAHLEALIMGNE